jgi:hypothetical protein
MTRNDRRLPACPGDLREKSQAATMPSGNDASASGKQIDDYANGIGPQLCREMAVPESAGTFCAINYVCNYAEQRSPASADAGTFTRVNPVCNYSAHDRLPRHRSRRLRE